MIEYINHLVELRGRLIKSICFFFIIFSCLFYFSQSLYHWLALPLLKQLPDGHHLVATQLPATLMAPLKLSLFLSFLISMPFFLYQLWKFIAPGLYKHEKKLITPVIILSSLLFYLGILFAFYCILPMTLNFFVLIAPKDVLIMTDIHHYLEFVTTICLGSGISFQIPMLTLMSIRLGWVSMAAYQKARPHIIVLAFVLGMVLTPPDVISQVLLALPIWGLFELGLFASRFRILILQNGT